MIIKTRISSSGFIDISVDEISTTIFANSENEIKETISNLEEVIEDLKHLRDRYGNR